MAVSYFNFITFFCGFPYKECKKLWWPILYQILNFKSVFLEEENNLANHNVPSSKVLLFLDLMLKGIGKM